MKISVIIAFYKDIEALSLILKALQHQSARNFEVIIAEDDNCQKAQLFINEVTTQYLFPISHLKQQEDLGFRKNQMLNKAIEHSTGEGIVFLDGDCIPHRHLIKQYRKLFKPNIALFGRRVMLSEAISEDIKKNKSTYQINLYRLIKSNSKRLKYAIYLPFLKRKREAGVWGCNWGIMKKHLLEINGFDEDYVKAGVGEDVDIEWRLKQIGITFISIRQRALVYHLHHKENYTPEIIKENLNLFYKKKEANNIICINGIQKL